MASDNGKIPISKIVMVSVDQFLSSFRILDGMIDKRISDLREGFKMELQKFVNENNGRNNFDILFKNKLKSMKKNYNGMLKKVINEAIDGFF